MELFLSLPSSEKKEVVEKEWDVIIIGGSASGLTASIYAQRGGCKTLVITKNLGGQVVETSLIENYPGFVSISGKELIKKIKEQAEKNGVLIKTNEEVKEIKKESIKFKIKTEKGNEYESKAIIIATGVRHKELGVKGEKELKGKGVCYCIECDAPLFKNKKVCVVGGGNSALYGALRLSEIAKEVYLIHRRDRFRGEKILVERIKMKENIKIILNAVVKEIIGKEKVEKIKIRHIKDDKEEEISCNGIFIEIGTIPNSELAKNIGIKVNDKGEIKVNEEMNTNIPGIFACGDVINRRDKQIATAVGTGCIAGISAREYVRNIS